MKKLILPLVLQTLTCVPASSFAAEKGMSLDEMSKQLANPLAQIWSLSFQHNRINVGGDLVEDDTINVTNFQPILPIPLKDDWMFFARPVITYIDAPTSGELAGDSPFHPTIGGINRDAGIGDTILPMGIGKSKLGGWTWGLGVSFIFPTADHPLHGSNKYQAGPAAIAVHTSDDWVVGGLLQHWWDIGNDSASDDDPIVKAHHEQDANHTDLQYFIIRQLPKAWELRASPHITADWEADSDNRWTIPLGIGVGKMFKLGPMPVKLMAEVQYPVVKPDDVAAELNFVLQVNFVIKNPFGTL